MELKSKIDLSYRIMPALPAHDEAIENLLDAAFGISRRTKTSYRFREGEMPVDGLSFVALTDVGEVIGAISFWHLRIGAAGVPALLLGPLAVKPDLQHCGIGLALMEFGIAASAEAGHGLVILVGDEPYYRRAGFSKVPDGQLQFPGPVDPARLLYRELTTGVMATASGLVLPPSRFSALRDTRSG